MAEPPAKPLPLAPAGGGSPRASGTPKLPVHRAQGRGKPVNGGNNNNNSKESTDDEVRKEGKGGGILFSLCCFLFRMFLRSLYKTSVLLTNVRIPVFFFFLPFFFLSFSTDIVFFWKYFCR